MDLIQIISENKSLQVKLSNFINLYGVAELEDALQIYEDTHHEYIFKNKSSIIKINVNDIYYLEISGHNIVVHTTTDTYYKYGTLNDELTFLSRYGFMKCRQNCVISIPKIKSIRNNDIILENDEVLHMSKRYANKIILAYLSLPLNNL